MTTKSITFNANGTAAASKVDEAGIVEIGIDAIRLNENNSGKKAKNQKSPSSPEIVQDPIRPSEVHRTWTRDSVVKLKLNACTPNDIRSRAPQLVTSVFRNTCNRYPNNIALVQKVGGVKKTWTYTQYWDEVWMAAKGFVKLGLEPYHGVGIIGFNAPEWFFSEIAAIFAGGLPTGIYTTNSADACRYVAADCEANIIVVEDEKQLEKILQIRDQLPSLKAIIMYQGQPPIQDDQIWTWEKMLALGDQVSDKEIEDRVKSLVVNQCCTLIYTSGTTGNPKGVMLSHDNVTWTAAAIAKETDQSFGNEIGLSYLPLSHIAAKIVDIYGPITIGATVHFAQPDALKGSLGVSMKEVRPTFFIGVPRVWEKIEEQMKEIGKQTKGLKRKIVNWAKDVSYRGNMILLSGGGHYNLPLGWGLADKMVFTKVKKNLGLDRCKFCLTAAAPIMMETLEFFLRMNIQILDLYGMSESTGPHTISLPGRNRLGAVGKEFNGVSTLIYKPDDDGNGEICMEGRHVFMGYLNMEEKTMSAIDDQGFLHSEDVGKKDSDGFLYITGRLKELIITAGGENVAPVPIEDRTKTQLPVISNCMVIGDQRKFLSALLTLKCVMDMDKNVSTDVLTPAALDWVRGIGSHSSTLSQILNNDDKVKTAIQAGIDKTNSDAVSRAQCIQKWTILREDFSVGNGELGPTLKLKRGYVMKKYKEIIDAMYGDATQISVQSSKL